MATPPPIKSPFEPLRFPEGPISPDMLRQNFDRIKEWSAKLTQQIQVTYIAIPTPSGGGPGVITGANLFTLDYGTNTIQDASGNELLAIQRELPEGYTSFLVVFAGRAQSTGGTATFRVRLGGTDQGVNGAIIATVFQPAGAGFARVVTSAMVANPGAATLIKITIQSPVGQKAIMRDMVVSGNAAVGAGGIPGPAGTAGFPGAQGPPGYPFFMSDGEDGEAGMVVPGTTGPSGTPGSAGPQGNSGPPGFAMDGEDGNDGLVVPGPQGLTGPTGGTGSPGPSGVHLWGDEGEEGPMGMPVPGTPGSQGATGSVGPASVPIWANDGEDGADSVIPGPVGPQGALGPPVGLGFAGDTGDDGNDGLAIPGLQGPPGAQGALGFGLPGDDGEDAFTIPGAAGTPGTAGLGYPGLTGDEGEPGNDGIPVVGLTGSAGPTGPAGPTNVTIGTATVTVAAALRKSGKFFIEPTGGFSASQVGKPVLMQRAPGVRSFDEAELEAQMDFAAEVLNPKAMRVFWASRIPMRGNVRVNYLIGA
jgi:hypothetical protein